MYSSISDRISNYRSKVEVRGLDGLKSRAMTRTMASDKTASIFCDGACSGNGTARAYGGWAWAFWPGLAKGEPTAYGAQKLVAGPGMPSTNQRAELTALLEAIRFALKRPETVTIYTDSMYAINCTSKWGPGWKRKGWKRDSGEPPATGVAGAKPFYQTGKPLQNLDLVKQLVDLWKPSVALVHVRGHQTGTGPAVHGNNWVDRAAVAAARGEDIVSTASPTVLALSIPEDGDIIEHVLDLPPPAALPASKPKPRVTVKAPRAADVKQADIRMWFGS